jgi:DNA-binding LacI/PurR family transcriptional regulator
MMSCTILYRRITSDIKSLIDSGSLHPGDKIPSVNVLKEQYGVSHITAMKVYQELSKDNYVTQKRGRGYFVRDAESFKQVKRTGNIGNFIRPLREYCLEDNYFNDINCGIQDSCCSQRINLWSSHSTLPLNHMPINQAALGHIEHAMLDCIDQVDGYLVDERIPDDIIAKVIQQSSKPVVIVNRTTELKADSITPANRQGVLQALDVALRMGYSKFILARPGNRVSNNVERYEAFMEFIKASSIDVDSYQVIDDCSIVPWDETIPLIVAGVKKFQPVGRTLFISCGDAYARQLCNTFQKMNLQPGKDLGILCCEGFGFSKLNKPEIAAVQSQPVEMGKLAVKTLLNRLNHDNFTTPGNVTPEPTFTFGETL